MANLKNKIKSYLPKSLLGRSILIIAIPALFVQLISVVVFFDNHWSKVTSKMAASVAGEVSYIISRYDDNSSFQDGDIEKFKHMDINIGSIDDGSLKRGVTKGVFYGILKRTLEKEIKARIDNSFSVYVSSVDKRVFVNVKVNNDYIRMIFPRRKLFSSSSYVFLLWMSSSTIILFAIAIIFMRNQIRPIRKLAIAADKFGTGREIPFFKVEGAREIRRAGKAFVRMQERIKGHLFQRTTMLAGISHDLRTPITRMKLQIAMLPESDDINDLKLDLEDMELMIQSYLDFVKGEQDEAPALTDMKDVIMKHVSISRKHGVNVECNIIDNVSLMVKPLAIDRCVSNIIGNAEKYGQNIWVVVKKENENLIIDIEDDGPGIKEEYRIDVFKPFYRIDKSRSTKARGVGLGLSISIDAAKSHGGNIFVNDSEYGGTKFSISIPL